MRSAQFTHWKNIFNNCVGGRQLGWFPYYFPVIMRSLTFVVLICFSIYFHICRPSAVFAGPTVARLRVYVYIVTSPVFHPRGVVAETALEYACELRFFAVASDIRSPSQQPVSSNASTP